jgi:peptide/nickel transport system permease protein
VQRADARPVSEATALSSAPRLATIARLGRLLRREPLGGIGAVIVVALLAMTIGTPQARFGFSLPDSPLGFELGKPWLARYDKDQMFRDSESGKLAHFRPPSGRNWLGTDDGGRDNWSRLVWGARRSLFIAFWAMAIATTAGAAVGLISAYFGGWLDTLLQRLMDALLAFPPLLVLLLLLTVTEPSLLVLAVGLGIVGIPLIQRVVRGVALSEREQPYMQAARLAGATNARMIVFHLLPNIAAPIILLAALGMGAVILIEATITFVAPQHVPFSPSWGIILNSGRNVMLDSPWTALSAGFAITLAVSGFNLLGDTLRDALDPRLHVN